jgi:hypothetical protein
MNARNGIRALLAAAILVVIAAVVAGLMAIGSPEQLRKRKLDERRISDLDTISRNLRLYWDSRKQLPPDLFAMTKQPGWHMPVDPETGAAFEYVVTGEGKYRLCAIFTLESGEQPREHSASNEWAHGAGHTCFDRRVEKLAGSD